jgi:hypothetical protein
MARIPSALPHGNPLFYIDGAVTIQDCGSFLAALLGRGLHRNDDIALAYTLGEVAGIHIRDAAVLEQRSKFLRLRSATGFLGVMISAEDQNVIPAKAPDFQFLHQLACL